MNAKLQNVCAQLTLSLGFSLLALAHVAAAETWPFTPDKDGFSDQAMFDLRSLNEAVAGQSGWLRVNADGDFVRGDGKDIRFWALNTGIEKYEANQRPLWSFMPKQDLAYHARWLAKRGVNMVRLGVGIQPDPKKHASLDDANAEVCEWVWKAVGKMSQEGIYSTVSPYWAFLFKSDDKKWGTDWDGKHAGILFFDERMKKAYKSWLRYLMTTPSKHLGGKTLAEHAGMGIFQIQNEDSMLFWTIRVMSPAVEKRLGQLFYQWTVKKYGSIDTAKATWGDAHSDKDALADKCLGILNLWFMSVDGRKQGPNTQRINDQLQFYTETMYNFNKEIEDFIRNDLKCPVLINAGNWKTGDTLLLNDAERYSYTANDVIAVNRYFGGVHNGKNRGWAIINGDEYTSKSAVADGALDFPLNLKQVSGKPMIIPETLWVFPDELAHQAPLMVAAYSSLNGVDAAYWNGADNNDWTQPKAANGYMPSMKKWICVTPDSAGHWPAAAYLLRKGLVKRGQAVVDEHRSLNSIYEGKTPIIAESASFDPNRDAGDVAPNSAVKSGVTPWAFLVGPVTVTYDSDESNSSVVDLDAFISPSGNGKRVESITGEIVLDTGKEHFTVNTAQCQAVTGNFSSNTSIALQDVTFTINNKHSSIIVLSMDNKPLAESEKILIQVGNTCRPTDWATEPCQIEIKGKGTVPGKRITNYGKRPWQMTNNNVSISINNTNIKQAHVLDMNGMPQSTSTLTATNGKTDITLPEQAFYLMLTK